MEKTKNFVRSDIQRIKKMNKVKEYAFFYGLLLIPILHWLTFWVYVNLNSFLLPFQDTITREFTWANFEFVFELFKTGGELVIAFKNTLIYYISGLIQSFVIALLFSYFLFKKILGYRIYAVVFMLPSIISSVIMISIYKNLLGANGPIAMLYEKLTGETMPFLLYSEKTATWTIVAYGVWIGFGMNLILYSGALAKIPPEVIESTQLDGVGFFREFISIELPMIWPTISITLLLGVNGIFMASGPILMFTEGMYETMTIDYWFYEKVIMENNYGVASAFGLLLTLAGAPLTIFVQWIRHKLPSDVQY